MCGSVGVGAWWWFLTFNETVLKVIHVCVGLSVHFPVEILRVVCPSIFGPSSYG